MFALTVPFPWVTDQEVSEAGVRWDPGFIIRLPDGRDLAELLISRLRNQQLIESTRRKPAQVVSWLCAMQAQDYPAAKWAIGSRAPGCQDGDVEQAFNDGLILRTHVLRPTWHFVAPAGHPLDARAQRAARARASTPTTTARPGSTRRRSPGAAR